MKTRKYSISLFMSTVKKKIITKLSSRAFLFSPYTKRQLSSGQWLDLDTPSKVSLDYHKPKLFLVL